MRVLEVRNACEALPAGLELLLREGRRCRSRAGDVIAAPWPVVTAYSRPRERAPLSPLRDANPFFLLAELAWMLAGRGDAALLSDFVKNYGERYGEPDGRVHGAYGARWRSALGFDQLDVVVEKLRLDPADRQVVLQMWDARAEPVDSGGILWTSGCDDLRGKFNDRPCNSHAYPRLVGGKLDITVCCRSNDAVWGAYASDVVDFSGLQEYLAARINVPVGTYYQVSNNFHAYVAELDRVGARAGLASGDWAELPEMLRDRSYEENIAAPAPLVANAATFDAEVARVLVLYESLGREPAEAGEHEEVAAMKNEWLRETLWPALLAHRSWRAGDKSAALAWARTVSSTDWRQACVGWLLRRRKHD